ncbi:MAG: restriction endonuclease subunit S [Parcubacteria group bacterium]
MQYSVVNYKTVIKADDFRWDGEFLCFEPHKNKNYRYFSIGEILKFAQYGISIDMNESGQGYKIYRMNEISNMFCDFDVDKYADINEQEMKKFELKNNDVVFNRTNSQAFVGRTGIFRKFSDEPFVFASYLVRFRPDQKKVLPEYLTTFLNTKYGVQDVQRRARISINQSNVSASELEKVEMPLLSINFQNKLIPLFDKSFHSIVESKKYYFQAEQLLLSEIGLSNWVPKQDLVFIKKFSETEKAERIDAEYFQPKYEEIIDAVKKCKNGFVKLGEVAKTKRGSLISDNLYREGKGIGYIRGADFSSGFLSNDKMIYIDDSFKKTNETKVNQGDIVFALIGTVGSSALVEKDFDGAFISNNLGKISVKNYNSTILQVLFHSVVGKMYFAKEQTQTAQPKISDKDIYDFILPKFDSKTEKEIEKLYFDSQKAKHLFKSLLEIAKRVVEMAIEKDEKEAEKWIDKELKQLDVKITS